MLKETGKKESTRRETRKKRVVLSKTLEVLGRHLRTGAQKTHMGLVPARIWWHEAFRICPTQRTRIKGKKKQASFHIFLEVAKRWDERGEDKTLNELRVEVMLGNKEARRRETWKRRVVIVKTLNVFQRQYLRTGTLSS